MEHLKVVESSDLYARICSSASSEVAAFIINNLDSDGLNIEPWLQKTDSNSDYGNLRDSRFIIDLVDVSEVDDLTVHFRAINGRMAKHGIYVGCFESKYNIQLKLFKRYNRALYNFVRMVNYTFRNFVPRWKGLTRQGKSVISLMYRNNSLAEVLGRLAYCGFEIVNFKYFDNLTYFIIRKKTEPRFEKVSTSRFIVRLDRVGKGGNCIGIYKIRTMYPYSEFIQDYVVKINGYDAMGKPKNDFRLTPFGRIIRKLWIDEIPQIYNLLKGDISLVGVRPISKYGFGKLPPDLQSKRICYMPGLISPHVSLRFKGFDGVIRAERQYLKERENNPIRTNIKYFFLALFNIITLRAKSS